MKSKNDFHTETTKEESNVVKGDVVDLKERRRRKSSREDRARKKRRPVVSVFILLWRRRIGRILLKQRKRQRTRCVRKSLMSNEERRFVWNIAFSFTIAHRGAAFKAFRAIRSSFFMVFSWAHK